MSIAIEGWERASRNAPGGQQDCFLPAGGGGGCSHIRPAVLCETSHIKEGIRLVLRRVGSVVLM